MINKQTINDTPKSTSAPHDAFKAASYVNIAIIVFEISLRQKLGEEEQKQKYANFMHP